jgi:8-amino-7-oxononanoate synthase
VSAFEQWLADEAARREELGLSRRLVEADRTPPLVNLAGNDYLGLATDARVITAAVAAAERFGAGATASRLVCGTLSLHTDVERELAGFTGFPTALVCSTGYQANLSVVSALADPDTLIISDAHVHASLIDACRLARATVHVVGHNDVDGMDRALAARGTRRALVLVESVYSVLGDAAPLIDVAEICHRHGAVLVVDEAHALGVAGPGGRALCQAYGLAGRPDIIATVTLSKSLGAQGGAVLCVRAVRDHLVNRARPFIYDTGLAPAAAGAALAALRIIAAEPERVARVNRFASALAAACRAPHPAAAVLSVPMPGPHETVAAVAAAAACGVRIGCFRPPSTPDGSSRLRFTAHSELSAGDLDLAARVLDQILTADALPSAEAVG